MARKQKLELTWVGKDQRPRLEPRILLEDVTRSYHAATRQSGKDIFDNILIHGDNLLALRALQPEHAGEVKCVYIDPPFNTKQAFEHYDDGLEHSIWLSLMRDRLEIIKSLLSDDGTIFVHIDENELAYLTVIMDEIFGRRNRISIITFTQSAASGPKAINPGIVTTNNFLLYYVKDKSRWRPNRVFVPTTRDDRYSKFIDNLQSDHKQWRIRPLRDAFLSHEKLESWPEAQKKFNVRLEDRIAEFVLSHADRVIRTARVAPKDVNETARAALQRSERETGVQHSARHDKEDYYFVNGEQIVFYRSKTKIIDGDITTASPLTNLWDDLLSNNLHKEGGVDFPNGKKPESLIKRCLELATSPGDLVLDSFAGSGTTAAVAHKMKCRWIAVEVGDQASTHIVPRLQRVIDGRDNSGITKAVDWRGGGGFRYTRLAPSLLELDKWGREVISKEYNAEMLAEALCKLEGFNYAPSADVYWQQGHSSERDFIFVTTQTLGPEELTVLNDEVGDHRSLLVLCSAFRGETGNWPNLTVRKIPNHIRSRCEWGHDDYSLNVANLPMAEAPPREPVQQGLFGDDEDAQ